MIHHIRDYMTFFDLRASEAAEWYKVDKSTINSWLADLEHPDDDEYWEGYPYLEMAMTLLELNGVRSGKYFINWTKLDGKTILDLKKSGELKPYHIHFQVHQFKEMQAAYDRSKLSKSKAKSTDDWKSEISIPGGLEPEECDDVKNGYFNYLKHYLDFIKKDDLKRKVFGHR